MIWSWYGHMMSLWYLYCHIISCDFMSHVILSVLNVIWCHMMWCDRICPGHCKLLYHKWHASDFALQNWLLWRFKTLKWHTFLLAWFLQHLFADLYLASCVDLTWFYHWRHRTWQNREITLIIHWYTSSHQKKNILKVPICFFPAKKKRHFHQVTAAPGFYPTPWNGPTQPGDPPVKRWCKGAMGAQGDRNVASSRTRWRTFFRPSFNHSHLSTWLPGNLWKNSWKKLWYLQANSLPDI